MANLLSQLLAVFTSESKSAMRLPSLFCSLHCRVLILALAAMVSMVSSAPASPWSVPMGGNAYLTASPENGQDGLSQRGLRWQEAETVFSIYFRVDRPAVLDLALQIKVPEGESVIEARIGDKWLKLKVAAGDGEEVSLGKVEVKQAGYVRVDLQGISRSGPAFAEVSNLAVKSNTAGLVLDFVKSNEGNMYYWGRRGPSVHLSYQTPNNVAIEYAYSEITVPEGGDAIGSYYMANGFGEGYFGIQVKSPTERWVLFSVWSPFNTDNPKDIPEAERVQLLAKGDSVKAGEFGNEGSGGQSYWIYPWKTGTTYRFLNSVKPDGQGNSTYTAWIGEGKEGEWQLVARFKRPKTNKHLTGFHSFLENFADQNGWLERRSLHGNQWVCDTSGTWHEITSARFTGDDTARGRHRMDYAGGVEGQGFFMKNGGFFAEPVTLDSRFERPSTPTQKPQIDFAKLPGM
jgi:Domain of unknown function (DUF3472)/Domain of unknown function (DUF5077)